MRIAHGVVLASTLACAAEGEGAAAKITLPQVYPPVRAATPTALIADARYAELAAPGTAAAPKGLGRAEHALGEAINLATAIQERFYSAGPTALLRIVKDLDDRVSGLDTDPSKHECLTGTPVASTFSFAAGQTLTVKLQCMQTFGTPGSGGGWIAFGFDAASAADAGPTAASAGNDFYLVQGQDGGMGGAYHIAGGSGDIEAWMTVADSRAPQNSQVLMHMLTNEAAQTLELVLAGSGVGFCSAHLKTNSDFVFISGKTNGVAPPGTAVVANTQYCDAPRSGCFEATALAADLGADSASCAGIAAGTFAMTTNLDASSATGANVTPATIHTYFGQAPAGIPAF